MLGDEGFAVDFCVRFDGFLDGVVVEVVGFFDRTAVL
jgi:hypothetical protein